MRFLSKYISISQIKSRRTAPSTLGGRMKIIIFLHLTVLCKDNIFVVSEIQRNVAFNMNSTYCAGTEIIETMTDGEKSITTGFKSDVTCFPNSYVTVDFGRQLYYHYAVVYEGKSIESSTGQLDYFRIASPYYDHTRLCGMFPWRSIGPKENRGMRVNCNYMGTLFSSAILQSNIGTGLNVAEIEIYSFALDNNDDYVWIPRGCYEEVMSTGMIPFQGWRNCKTECKSKGVPYAAIKNNEECHCVAECYESYARPLGECDKLCADSDYYCGGEERYSVYIVELELTRYIACVLVSSVPEVMLRETYTEENMTVTYCLSVCEKYTRALLRGGGTCVCSIDATHNISTANSYLNGKDDLGAEKCDLKCLGDPETTCGGDEYFSVYRTCYYSWPEIKCSGFFKCSGKMDGYGACDESGCQGGFIGEHCVERRSLSAESYANGSESICNVYNPCSVIPHSECEDVDGYYICQCIEEALESDGTCIALNETGCSKELCDPTTSDCLNVNGKFVCACTSGYIAISSYCLDVTILIILVILAIVAAIPGALHFVKRPAAKLVPEEPAEPAL